MFLAEELETEVFACMLREEAYEDSAREQMSRGQEEMLPLKPTPMKS
jgi:hypothetical protein